MELLDIYDENQNYIGKEERSIVHHKGLWHKTIHCWLYDQNKNIYFQIRKDRGTLYTTASGHVQAGETLTEAFGREIKEELGIDINYEEAKLIEIVNFTMDRKLKDGSIFKDRAFANVYGYLYDNDDQFNLDQKEVIGLVKVSASATLELFQGKKDNIVGTIINLDNTVTTKVLKKEDFLVNDNETYLDKYGNILEFVINQ